MVNKKIIAYGTLIMFQTDHNAQFPMNASKEWYKLSTYVRGLVTHSSKQLLSSFFFFSLPSEKASCHSLHRQLICYGF